MLFNSYTFIFLFLPVTLLTFYTLANRANFTIALAVLVLSSFIFYAYWNPAYLVLLLISISINFVTGRLLIEYRRKLTLIIGLLFNLTLIGYYKYAGFLVVSTNEFTGSQFAFDTIVLPLGISFFTFQQITYLVDAYKGLAKKYNVLEYCQFVTFFPQLIAGPIVHHHEMMPQFNQQKILANIRENISVGLTIFFIGLFKKVILADSVAVYATPVFDSAETGITLTIYEAWIGALAYSCQLYFDFSGYSDMAIGLARLFGITLPVNFNSPYKATSIIEFWRRWHITLSRFLRDYLYIPLGGNRRGVVFRKINIFITMLLGGLWHGAGWTFVIWGAMHGGFLIVNHLWRYWRCHSSEQTGNDCRLYIISARFLTLLVVVVAWVVFRAESTDAAKSLLTSMSGFNGIALPAQFAFLADQTPSIIAAFNLSFGHMFHNELYQPTTAFMWIMSLFLIALFAPNTQEIMRHYRPVPGLIRVSAITWKPNILWLVCISSLSLFTLLHLSRVSEFLYFQF